MDKLLLSLHVVAAIVFVGPVTVAVSLFPRHARLALAGDEQAVPVVRLLHRIARVYAVVGLCVPVLGVALAARLHVLGDAWLVISIGLTFAAAVILAVAVLPAQHRAVDLLDTSTPSDLGRVAWSDGSRRLAMASGVFALLWVVVVVLMVVRPGSTTGV
ncbi:MAG TPA: DUF2269 family protein [Pseudonocardia sp.]